MKIFQRSSGRLYERQDILPLAQLMKDCELINRVYVVERNLISQYRQAGEVTVDNS
jgi:hypothetical protein